MTKLQRRLLVASVAVMFFLGPLFIMGNCSGWNEGSMKVAACVVDVAPLRGLANLLYGLVLFSAFMLALPILAYIVVALVITRLVAVVLRRTFPDNTVAKPWGPLLAVMAVPGLIVLSAVASVGTSLLGLRAMSSAFVDRCKTAVEVVTKAPDGPVEGLYFGSPGLPGYTPTDMVEDGWLGFSEALNPDTRPGAQATAKYLRYALYRERSGEPATAVTSQYGVFLKDQTTEADREAGIEGAESSVKKLATDETLATTTYFMMMGGGRYCSAGQVQKSDSWVNGVASSFSYVPFLVRALGLKQHAGAPLQPESKPARPRESSTPVHVGDGKTGTDWTLIAETDNSRIYIDKSGLSEDEQVHSVWRMENIDTPGADHVASVRSHFTVDCAKRQFTPELEWAMSGPMGSGPVIFVPRQFNGPRAPVPNSAGELMLNTVCGK